MHSRRGGKGAKGAKPCSGLEFLVLKDCGVDVGDGSFIVRVKKIEVSRM